MDARTFFYAVSKMREAQKAYFRTRSQVALRAARAAENEIDAEIERTKVTLRQHELTSSGDRLMTIPELIEAFILSSE